MARFKFVTIAAIAMVLAVSFEYGAWKNKQTNKLQAKFLF